MSMLENAKTRQIANPGFGFALKAKPGFRVWVSGLQNLVNLSQQMSQSCGPPMLCNLMVTISLYVDISLKGQSSVQLKCHFSFAISFVGLKCPFFPYFETHFRGKA